MGTVVTVMNMKGGVGKTTVTAHLGGFLSLYGDDGTSPLNVLMIDYDPQFNLSQAYLTPKNYFALEKARKTILAVLMDDSIALNPYQIQVPGNHTPPPVSSLVTELYKGHNGSGRLDIVPSTLDLMYVVLGQSTTRTDPIEERFAKFIAEARSIYDIVLIDCHPAGSLFTKTSLLNSDHVIIPVIPQKYSVRGIGLMLEFIKSEKNGNLGPTPIIMFNATARRGVSTEETLIRSNPKYASYCLPSTLKYFKAFGDAEAGGNFVWQSSKPYSTIAFMNLSNVVRDLRRRINI